ncbi:hypothetical protein [Deinococcus sp.]|uniref:hypothetical protein n=1 Tax=Deinococcus sp. TaxID=47478 RepID=UPI003B5BF5DD
MTRFRDLTPVEIADVLARMYAADQGATGDAPTPAQRTALADYLGCHEDARAAAFEAWVPELVSVTADEAEYWLDVEFVEPCPEDRVI